MMQIDVPPQWVQTNDALIMADGNDEKPTAQRAQDPSALFGPHAYALPPSPG